MKDEKFKHCAFYGEGFSVKGKFIQQLLKGKTPPELEGLKGKKGTLFSDSVLEKYIEEDQRHGNSQLIRGENRSLRTFSSGEKRKALLDFLLKQQPDFLILDDPFDCLDVQSIARLKRTLNEISNEIQILQVFKRKEDLLPLIEVIFQIENEEIVNTSKPEQFLANKSSLEELPKTKGIPKAPVHYKNIPEILVKLDKVSVNYENRPILNQISWEVRKGEFWKLSGPNGSGKTTILSMIYGDNPKAYGVELYLFGNKKGSGESVWDIKKKIGYFSPALTELFNRRNTVLEMLISGLVDSVGLYQKPNESQLRLAKEWLKTIGLEHMQKKIFTDLPILQQRMLLIARAMIKHPPLLILDEPSTSLDNKSVILLTNFINHIAAESNNAIIYVSHREEKGLNPDYTFELVPSKKGSEGRVIQNK